MQTRLASSLLTSTTFLLALIGIGILPAVAVDYRFTTVASASGGVGDRDGPVSQAQFNLPNGVSLDGAGNIYLADRGNHTIRKISPAGIVSTIAGATGVTGNQDGPGSLARFSNPEDVAVAPDGSVYVANGAPYPGIRRIAPNGNVSTIVTTGTMVPTSLAIDSNGVLYFSASFFNSIYRLTNSSDLTLFAGGQTAGSADGIGSNAQFNSPQAITVDSANNVFVVDSRNHTIRKITPAGVVSTFAGQPGSQFTGGSARSDVTFENLFGIAIDPSGNVFVASRSEIWKIGADDSASSFAGQFSSTSQLFTQFADGTGADAKFGAPIDFSADAAGNLLVIDSVNHAIRRVSASAQVTTVAGSPNTSATGMVRPTGIDLLPDGDAVVSVTGSGTLVRVTSDGTVTPFAGTEGNIPIIDIQPGQIFVTRIVDNTREHFFASAVAVDAMGNVYAPHQHSIRRMNPSGEVVTLAGVADQLGSADGSGEAARFNSPSAIAVDSQGNVFVADYWNFTIRRISPTGEVSTFAGTTGERGSVDGVGAQARFDLTSSIVVDPTDTLWVGSGDSIRKISPTGLVTTVAEGFDRNMALAFAPSGDLWSAQTNGSSIRKMAPDTTVTTIAGGLGLRASVDGVGQDARFNQPAGIIVFPNGNILVADTENNELRLGTPVVNSVAFLGTYFGTTASGAHWALWVDVPGHGIFTTQLPGAEAVLIAEVTIDAQDQFTGSALETLPTTSTETPRTIDVSGSIFQVSQGVIHVEGQLGPSGETFTGEFPRSPAGIPFSGSYYTAIALGTESGTLRISVGLSGDYYAVITLSDQVDSVRGMLDPLGRTTMTTQNGALLDLAIDLNARTTTASLSLPISASTAQRQPNAESDSLSRVPSADETTRTINFAGLAAGVTPTTRLVNLSIRSQAGTGDETLVMGFVVAGPGTKPALLRGIGPTLADFGLTGTLANPRLRLFDQTSTTSPIEENDDWSGTTDLRNLFSTLGAFPLDDASQDAAIFRPLPAGPYTAQITASETGIALAEAYDSGSGRETRFVNLSARTNAGIGAEVLTAGFVVTGNAPVKLLVRGIGPTLGSLGVAGVLSDPILRVFDQDGLNIAENDNWDGAAELSTAFATVGAFGLSATDSKDAAMIVSLVPGSYTVQLSGSSDDVGVALVELYEMP